MPSPLSLSPNHPVPRVPCIRIFTSSPWGIQLLTPCPLPHRAASLLEPCCLAERAVVQEGTGSGSVVTAASKPATTEFLQDVGTHAGWWGCPCLVAAGGTGGKGEHWALWMWLQTPAATLSYFNRVPIIRIPRKGPRLMLGCPGSLNCMGGEGATERRWKKCP